MKFSILFVLTIVLFLSAVLYNEFFYKTNEISNQNSSENLIEIGNLKIKNYKIEDIKELEQTALNLSQKKYKKAFTSSLKLVDDYPDVTAYVSEVYFFNLIQNSEKNQMEILLLFDKIPEKISGYGKMNAIKGLWELIQNNPEKAQLYFEYALETKNYPFYILEPLMNLYLTAGNYEKAKYLVETQSSQKPELGFNNSVLEKYDFSFESQMSVYSTSHFYIRYHGEEYYDIVRLLGKILENSINFITEKLNYTLYGRINVLLYPKKMNSDLPLPDWTGALFDGKIRLSYAVFGEDINKIERTCKHELTHAVVYQINSSTKTPVWLNEGLAQYMEFSPNQFDKLKEYRYKPSNKYNIELKYLSDSFMNMDSSMAQYAYRKSLSALIFLIDNYGFDRVSIMLSRLKENDDFEEIMRNTIGLDYEALENDWKIWLKRI